MGMEGPSPEAAAVTAPALAALRARPGFDAALEIAARAGAKVYETDPIRRLVISDRERFVFVNAALDLHLNGAEGLTAGRLRDALARFGIGGPNRSQAIIALLRWGGYIEPTTDPADRRRKVMVPTARMTESFREMVRDQFTALSMAAPEYANAPRRLDDPAFFAAFLRRQHRGFLNGFRLTGLSPVAERFMDRNCGFPLLISLYLAGEQPVSVSALARRFGVSRTHVMRLLADAEAEGLALREPAPRRLPGLADVVASFFGSGMLFNAAIIDDVERTLAAQAD